MRRLTAVAVALVLAGSATTLASRLATSEKQSRPFQPQDTGGPDGAAPYESPRRRTPGEYRSPVVFTKGAEAKGERLQYDDHAKPHFEGFVNGVYLWSQNRPNDPALGQRPCPLADARAIPENEQPGHELYIPVPSYLPPGAFEIAPPQMLLCPDGRVTHVGRSFELRPYGGEIGVIRIVGTTAAEIGELSKDRISAGAVNGKQAAFVKPVTDEGFGNSWIFVRESFGLTGFSGGDLPLEELLRVAGAVVER